MNKKSLESLGLALVAACFWVGAVLVLTGTRSYSFADTSAIGLGAALMMYALAVAWPAAGKKKGIQRIVEKILRAV
ncbi:MAG: hypothetical protein HY917_02320 [Candidatus Diapherotrites archaeon]|nr:hypothetical protein [Candidatus Diapherotrites archaeon]